MTTEPATGCHNHRSCNGEFECHSCLRTNKGAARCLTITNITAVPGCTSAQILPERGRAAALGSTAALSPTSTFPGRAVEPSLATTINCPKLTVEALPAGWVLPPAHHQSGPSRRRWPAPGSRCRPRRRGWEHPPQRLTIIVCINESVNSFD